MSTKKSGPKAEPISASAIKNLSDKIYDTRKLGALEVEQQVRELFRSAQHDKIVELLLYLKDKFIKSSSLSSRKGGLVAIAGVALGLGADSILFLDHIVLPVKDCFIDNDSKVRYYACESLFNIAKATRGHILQYFPDIFDELCRLAADNDNGVRSAAEKLDILIKEIVTEGGVFDVDKFIIMLQKRITVINQDCRRFLVNWLLTLDHVPGMDLIKYLPSYIDGLFKMLNNPGEELRTTVSKALFGFLEDVRKKPSLVSFSEVIPTLITHCRSQDPYNYITAVTAMTWLNEFISIAEELLLPLASFILSGILPNIAHQSAVVEDQAKKANLGLLDMVKKAKEGVNIKNILDTVQSQLTSSKVSTRLASLYWIQTLHTKDPKELSNYIEKLFSDLIGILGQDLSEEVVRVDLLVLSMLSNTDSTFTKLIESLIQQFRQDRKLLDTRANLVIRQLTLHIPAEKIIRAFAALLESDPDPEFASLLIQTLNIILLTATELYEVRESLKDLTNSNTQALFQDLYKSWSHNPAATLSLCFLAQAYEHATHLVSKFSDIEVSITFLVELDKLVQLLESPIFINLRLQMLEPENHPYLLKSLYSILMLLPQTNAFQSLKERLNCATSIGSLHLKTKSSSQKVEIPSSIDFDGLLSHFAKVQAFHAQHRRKARIETEKKGTTSIAKKTHPTSLTSSTHD